MKDEIKIEKGVKRAYVKRGRNGRYPYFEMKIGDSFAVPKTVKPGTGYGIAREGNKRAILEKKPHRFSAGKDETGIVRCWRVA